MNEDTSNEDTIMSQNKTTNKTNSSKTSRNRTSSPITAPKQTAAKEAIAPEAVIPEVVASEMIVTEPLLSDASTPDDANETLPVQQEELISADETEASSAASEALDIETAHSDEMDAGIEPDNAEDFNHPVRAEDVIESLKSDTNVDEVPVEEAAQSITEDASEPPSGDTVENAEVAVQTPSEMKPSVGTEKPVEKVKGLDRQLRATSPRYAAACAEVGRLRKGFLYALNRKAAILGVERVGEAVPFKNEEIDAIDAEIREVRQKLEDLMTRKKQLKGASPELDEVNQEIRGLSRQRQAARIEKQKIFEAEVGGLVIESSESVAKLGLK